MEVKKAVSQEEMRRQDVPKSRSGPTPAYFGRDSAAYGGGRDAYSYGRGGLTYGAMGKRTCCDRISEATHGTAVN